MTTVFLTPTFGVGYQGFTSGGLPLNQGLIYTYIAGGTTPQATYTTSAGNVPNANPIVLDADGRTPSEVWLLAGQSYRFDLKDSPGNLIKTYDNLYGIGDPGAANAIPGAFALSSVSGTNTITANASGALAALAVNQVFLLIPSATNTGPATLNVTPTGSSALGAKNVFWNGVACSGGELRQNIPAMLEYDGTQFNIIGNGFAAPFLDTNPIVEGSVDGTKRIRFEVDGLTTATTRVITPPDVDVTLPYKPGTYGSMQVYTTAGANIWTKPAGLKRVRVTVVGAGGGSGGAASGANTAGGSAAGGGFSIKTIDAASLGATETATVGAKGTGGASGNNDGTAGGTSSFGAHCSATGGAKGSGAPASAAGSPGAGGVGSGGDINGSGDAGSWGILASTVSGKGGASHMGGGAVGVSATSNGAAAGNYGAGASGGTSTGAGTAAGAPGSDGIIIVEEFF